MWQIKPVHLAFSAHYNIGILTYLLTNDGKNWLIHILGHLQPVNLKHLKSKVNGTPQATSRIGFGEHCCFLQETMTYCLSSSAPHNRDKLSRLIYGECCGGCYWLINGPLVHTRNCWGSKKATFAFGKPIKIVVAGCFTILTSIQQHQQLSEHGRSASRMRCALWPCSKCYTSASKAARLVSIHESKWSAPCSVALSICLYLCLYVSLSRLGIS